MILLDWRKAAAGSLAPLYERERQRWLRTLCWDTARSWADVEQARTTWGLPGLIAVDDAGRVDGVAFYVLEDGRLDIGGIHAGGPEATAVLLDGLITAARTNAVSAVRGLVLEAPPGLRPGLVMRGFGVESHLYLSRVLDARGGQEGESGRGRAAAVRFDGWREGDIEPAAALLRRAYMGKAAGLFAPGGAIAEWERYVRNIVLHTGCGVMNPMATQVLRDGTELRGIALITTISPGVAHLVQLAVDPEMRGRQVGRSLLESATGALAASRHRTLTLMVAGTNLAARSLYGSVGFRHDATFVAATIGAA